MLRLPLRCSTQLLLAIVPPAVDALPTPTHTPQAAAAARVAGKPDIWEAAKTGDIQLLRDRLTADPAEVNAKDRWQYNSYREYDPPPSIRS